MPPVIPVSVSSVLEEMRVIMRVESALLLFEAEASLTVPSAPILALNIGSSATHSFISSSKSKDDVTSDVICPNVGEPIVSSITPSMAFGWSGEKPLGYILILSGFVMR